MRSDKCKCQDEDINALIDLITRSKDVIVEALITKSTELDRKKSAHNCGLYEEAIKWVRKIAADFREAEKQSKSKNVPVTNDSQTFSSIVANMKRKKPQSDSESQFELESASVLAQKHKQRPKQQQQPTLERMTPRPQSPLHEWQTREWEPEEWPRWDMAPSPMRTQRKKQPPPSSPLGSKRNQYRTALGELASDRYGPSAIPMPREHPKPVSGLARVFTYGKESYVSGDKMEAFIRAKKAKVTEIISHDTSKGLIRFKVIYGKFQDPLPANLEIVLESPKAVQKYLTRLRRESKAKYEYLIRYEPRLYEVYAEEFSSNKPSGS